MREILFRGKTSDGEWVYGYIGTAFTMDENRKVKLRHFTALDCLGCSSQVIVLDETIGQYTGLTDKNGKKIFEGDIVHAIYQSNYVGMKNIDFGIGVVEYCGNYYSHASYEINIIGEIGSRVFSASLEGGVEVIGNIHDNPELLKGGEK